ncbi:hypothetical protein EGH21_12135 [Halomicroarcula sp. F13]|uniref:MYM-type domain-containing protein n=1 Tax=Haloarcula rubra TaxID=2487747 RepID=A0AAW4PS11_9EURY|nr:hypothetical protein [Halomicroarcula rubra]MBX0323778.1 hypothetical protein [Halomicroarcula rubra]
MDEKCLDGPLRATDRGRTCANCGEVIDTTEWYPVVSVPGEGYRIYAFCDEGCRDQWRQQTDR